MDAKTIRQGLDKSFLEFLRLQQVNERDAFAVARDMFRLFNTHLLLILHETLMKNRGAGLTQTDTGDPKKLNELFRSTFLPKEIAEMHEKAARQTIVDLFGEGGLRDAEKISTSFILSLSTSKSA